MARNIIDLPTLGDDGKLYRDTAVDMVESLIPNPWESCHAPDLLELENGDLLFRASLPQEEFFWRGALLALGTQIEVISPPEMVEEMRRRSRELNELYREKER